MSKATPYARLSVAEKQALQRDRMREPALACPHCETQTTAADLLRHVETTCPGRRAPHPSSRWITWSEARALGVLEGTLSKWVARGIVRSLDGDPRRYLMRDLARRLAERRQRRDFPSGERRRPKR